MTPRRMTLGEARFPKTPEFAQVRRMFSEAIVAQMLALVWEAWHALQANALKDIDISLADEQLERSLTEELERAMQDRLTHMEPYTVQHESWEMETRSGGSAQPRQYDIAFVFRANTRIKWPVETKILPTDGQIAAYVADIVDAFVTCIYAPFTGEGAMVGYLKKGEVDAAFQAIAVSLQTPLSDHSLASPRRPHKVSLHKRTVPTGKSYPKKLRCHHLLFDLSTARTFTP